MATKRSKNFVILPQRSRPPLASKPRVRVYQNDDEEKQEKGELSDEEKIAARQLNAQSFLLGAMRSLVYYHRKNTRYKNIIQYHGPALDLVSRLENPSTSGKFIGASSADLSMLTPKLEFFWFEYPPYKKGDPPPPPKVKPFIFSDHVSGDRMKKLEALSYSKSSEQWKRNFVGALGTKGTDVGIKEFVWTFDNKHHGDRTIKASLTIQFGSIRELLNPIFTEFILQQKPSRQAAGLSKEDMLVKISERYSHIQEYGDSSARLFQFEKSEDSTFGGLKQLKVVCGWAKPDIDPKSYPFGTEGIAKKEFLDGVNQTQKTIALNFVKHELNFGAEGQVTATIEYVGSLDSMMADAKRANVVDLKPTDGGRGRTARDAGMKRNGVFELPLAQSYKTGMTFGLAGLNAEGEFSKLAYGGEITGEGEEAELTVTGRGPYRRGDIREEYAGLLIRAIHEGIRKKKIDPVTQQPGFEFSLAACDYEEETLKLHKEYLMTYSDKGKTDLAEVEKIDNGLKAIRLVRALIMNRSSSVRYGKFLEKLYQTGGATGTKGLNFCSIKPKLIQGSAEEARRYGYTNFWNVGQLGIESGQGVVDLTKRATTALVQRQQEAAGIDPGEKVSADPLLAKHVDNDGEQVGDQIKIYYFTLGDLLDLALDDKDILEHTQSRVLLGTYNAQTAGVPNARKGDNFPIADFPIACDWFTQWFTENFAAKGRLEVSIREFLNKLFNDMVAPLMNDAYAEYLGDVKTGFGFATNTFPDVNTAAGPGKEGEKLFYREVKPGHYKYGGILSTRIRKGSRIHFQALDTLNQIMTHPTVIARPDLPSVNYFTVFSTSLDKSSLSGDYKEDMENGIFHLAVAADRGIVKSFKFTEKKMPQLKAMHIENNNQGSALILPQDLDLTMVGNTFFKNGQIIYVDADFALGTEVARKLGIGGYYQVVKVENVINPSKFETRVTAMFLQRPNVKSPQLDNLTFEEDAAQEDN